MSSSDESTYAVPTAAPTTVAQRPNSLAALWRPAVAGVAAAIAALGVAELVAAVLAPTASPVLSVGALIIDLVPAAVKDLVISLFGTADKIVLIISIGLVVVVLAAVAGIVEYRRPPWGRLIVVAAAGLALVAALTRSESAVFDAVPSIAAAGVGAFVLAVLTRRLSNRPVGEGTLDRRGFLALTGASAGVGILALIGGQLLLAGTRATDAARALFTLPPASVPGVPIAAGASFDVAGLSPIITPNADFYRIDTALQVPRIDPSTWTLRITGMVENEIEISFAELLALPLEESTTTLACVSNYVGGDLIGNAVWLGYPIRALLARAVPTGDADMVLSRSSDGFTAGTPLEALTDDRNAILAVGMNGDPLPLEHGYPVRMVVPGLYGYVSATKWVVELTVTRFDQEQGYWTPRGWSELGPVKLSSRIDVPRAGVQVEAGQVVVAGVAWSQYVGVSRVQVQIDGGEWNDATLADAISADTWRQWMFTWPAAAGAHSITVRATDAEGLVQTSVTRAVAPDGATGLHEVSVNVT
ncbi:molybdopterin-dependent oxidoreductase [Cryobacterium sp. CG_9.6]|uniref:molybdopterin-dependent oxidoreductase n=1 Tax=Cryobacterium sp. CG_9.6 TaxID=2760710 RepID=UPI00247549A2|nr:molybdopterin-dependent oxidoreductase [Cryobacterium sp. CG_9.6]MDH6237648.1 DMSO/TMAO reductase YedYZ molybdopterin-dependent catalytic subunit [Cryobacterium sp. CG_9.6]